MNNARGFHTASLLTNGKVFNYWWRNNNGFLVFPELYDPSTELWTNTANMTNRRYGHTQSVLTNEKVLITGGWSGSTLTSAELYQSFQTN